MKWLLAGTGFVLGLMTSRFETALGFAIFGFIIGLVIDLVRNKAPKASEVEDLRAELGAMKLRLERLEAAVAAGDAMQPAKARAAAAEPAAARSVAAPEADPGADADADAASPGAGFTTSADSRLAGAPSTDTPPIEPRNPSRPEPTFADLEPEPAPRPAGPSPLSVALGWFTGGNTVVKVGIVILFFGIAFLIKYAAEANLLPIELRLSAIALAAIAALIAGFRLAQRHAAALREDTDDEEARAMARIRRGYGLLLQGLAVGVLYLVIFGAFRLYNLLPGGFAFALMVATVVAAAILAVRQDTVALAAFGSAGGFLAPILASTGGGSHVGLFSFYLLLDAGICAIAWFQAWRVLNLVGFGFTFGIAAFWGANAYRPEQFATTEPFLVAFFALYVAIAILFTRRAVPNLRSPVDGTIVFGTPIVAFGLQAALVREMPFGAAFSAVAAAAVYLLLAAALKRRAAFRLLFECFVALGVVFATLAIPLALDGRWTAAVWAVEGAAVVWVGMRQSRLPARAFGYLVMAGAGIAFLADIDHARHGGEWPLLNAACVGAVLVALAALFVARLIDRADERVGANERLLAPAWTVWGCVWWVGAGAAEIDRWLSNTQGFGAFALFVAASGFVATLTAERIDWRRLQYALRAVLPLLVLTALAMLIDGRHPFAAIGWWAWPLALVLHTLAHRRRDQDEAADAVRLPPAWHALAIWLVTCLAVAELHHLTTRTELSASVWSASAAALPLVAMVLWLASGRAARLWPVNLHARAVLVTGLTPLIALGWAWVFYADWRYDGHAGPIAYVPLVNALDLMHLFVVAAFVMWARALGRESLPLPLPRNLLLGAFGAAVFFWLNAVLLRSIHQWGGVPYRFDDLMASTLVQAALSIFWTVLALTLMLIAHRRGLRVLWMTGAALMALTVGKLFVIDLSNIGGIERIVSFIGVGLLMLGVGYFSPLPPRRATAGESA